MNSSKNAHEAFLEKIEEDLRVIDREAVRLTVLPGEQGLLSMMRSAISLNRSSEAAGARVMAEVSQSVVSLLRSRNSLAGADTTASLLCRIDALRLIKEELSQPGGMAADLDWLLEEVEQVAMADDGLQPGGELAA